ncbi:hypothetical protein LIER_05929 [Lithospermum erythrorhizon]|uniref:Reverse transcriptase RNase H-like domain-containing protein n=1 Tax=Lithospermum erythrorhizon TaxID=34254 RepID=A0AAV3P2K1_LITER
MQSPQTQKEVQRLTGRIAPLTGFISRAGDRSFPFFKAIKKGSRVMRGAETRYTIAEKLVYALIIDARKLKPYFEVPPVEIITDQLLWKIVENPARPDG